METVKNWTSGGKSWTSQELRIFTLKRVNPELLRSSVSLFCRRKVEKLNFSKLGGNLGEGGARLKTLWGAFALSRNIIPQKGIGGRLHRLWATWDCGGVFALTTAVSSNTIVGLALGVGFGRSVCGGFVLSLRWFALGVGFDVIQKPRKR